MIIVAAFFLELFILFLLSKQLTGLLSSFFYRTTKSKKITILLMAFLFFPGTVIHELAHYLTALFLFVPAHRIEFFPKLEGDSLKLGSVSIAKTDFFRRLLIGMAPFFVGTTILLGTLYYAASNQLLENYFFIGLIGYVVFEIGNTMFSSKKDMEGAIELLLTLIIVALVFYLAGFPLPAINPDLFFSSPLIKQVFEKGSLFLLAPIGIDIAIILVLKLIHK